MDNEFAFMMMVAISFMLGWIKNVSKYFIRDATKPRFGIVVCHAHWLIMENYNASYRLFNVPHNSAQETDFLTVIL